MAGDPGSYSEPKAGPAADAADGVGGHLPAPQHEQIGNRAQSLSVSARRDGDRAGQSGLVLGRHLYPDGQGVSLPGGHHGLGEPGGAGMAVVQHARRRLLCRSARGSALAIRSARDLNTDQGSQFTSEDFTGVLKAHEIMISMDGKGRCMDNIFVERLWRSLKYEEV